MKIQPLHYQQMRDEIAKLAARMPAHREAVKASGKFKDLEKRIRWDALHAAIGSQWLCEVIYPYANDEHIDTALRAIMRELGLSSNS